MNKTLLLLCMLAHAAGAQTIHTLAGTGTAGYAGDGAMATAAQLSGPFSVAADNAGNVYIADRNNNRVRKVAATGIITTVAGNGTAGYSGDGGPATGAALNGPTGVATDNAGNIYIADRVNNRIRKVSPGGTITTIAGTGAAAAGGDGGAATAAELNAPRGIAVAGSVLYVADAGNHKVRKIDATGNITTIAGVGTAGYSGDGGPATAAQLYNPYSVTADAGGNVYIADVDNQRIRKVNPAGVITTLAGNGAGGYSGDGGAATAAALYEPISVAADSSGNIYIADGWNHRVRRVNTGGTIETIAGNGTAGYGGDGSTAVAAMLNHPYGIAYRNNRLYIADYDNNRVRYLGNPSEIARPEFGGAELIVFPNPTQGTINVRVVAASKATYSIAITDAAGKVINYATAEGDEVIAVPIATPGTYIVTAAAGTERVSKTIMAGKK